MRDALNADSARSARLSRSIANRLIFALLSDPSSMKPSRDDLAASALRILPKVSFGFTRGSDVKRVMDGDLLKPPWDPAWCATSVGEWRAEEEALRSDRDRSSPSLRVIDW